ncbi:kinesin-like protein KIN-14I isoform X2 [Salvia splendens]|uniref:kinesin-like protein KIN-14I isoform X2 n=1 Tax=Salvia splendens TaxID=180675 RepID=UPI001C25968E|nr:kinesin-like protein KIN-14I isoform X2 [Salvia splendens]
MAAIEGALPFSAASVVVDVLQQHGSRSRGLDFDARGAEEAAIRRYEAAAWLRKLVGVVAAKDLPAEPSEEEFRLGLRSGIILCNALNKVQAGAVQKVVESSSDAVLVPDGAALSAFQYFENVRNFLVAVEEMGMPTFEASDLEQGGNSSRVVNCVLALKSYSEWHKSGGNGVWKFGGNVRESTLRKQFAGKKYEPFTGSILRITSINEKGQTATCNEQDSNRTSTASLSMLVRAVLLDKKPEEVPNLVESVLCKVVEQFESRIRSQFEPKIACFRDSIIYQGNKCFVNPSSPRGKAEQKNDMSQKNKIDEEAERRFMNQHLIVDQQHQDIAVLKQTLLTTKAGLQFMQLKFHEEVENLGLHIRGLAYAASNHHRVLDENRKLYNQVQDLKGNIRVYCRVKPFLPGQYDHLSTVDHIEEGTICINTLAKNGKGRKSFNFNKVFGPSATQEEVFSDTQPLIRSVLDGYNVCIFAYGQTGSGKTFTMTGPRDLTEHSQGVNYRALRDLFMLADQRKDSFLYEVSVQMLEIYNEQVRDLLSSDGSSRRLEIRNSSQMGVSVPDASLVRVASTSDIIDLMNLGHKNRAVGATALNERSSRSHSCLTVHVQGRDLTTGSSLRGCMHLVDLAGSERVDKSEVTGDRLKEAQHINRSLSALGDVISSLAQKSSHVPYRNSKLTQLLQDSLGGQAKTLMFVHINPKPDAVGETISTLKFAERVASVELGAARMNKDSADVKELKEQIAGLKAALQEKTSGSGMRLSPYQHTSNSRDVSLTSPPGLRKPIEDVTNVKAHHRRSGKNRQSLDLNELLGNSPSWSSANSSRKSNVDEYDDREFCSGEWVDKLMVNKQDPFCGVDDLMTSWDPSNSNVSDAIRQKYPPDKPFGLFQTNNQFDAGDNDDVDELDAGTSDSSERDLLWQLNHSRRVSFASGGSPNVQKPIHKHTKSPEFRSMIPRFGPSPPSRKSVNGVGNGQPPLRVGRQATTETKLKTGSGK